MALRTLFVTIVIALNLGLVHQTVQNSSPVTAVPSDPAPPSAPTATPAPVHILRVRTTSPADATLLATHYDLLEMREGDDLFVQGDDAVAASLRARGYAVSVHQTLPVLSDRLGTATYYGGYRTVAEHYAHLDAVATDFSFPSGHAANTTLLYGALALLLIRHVRTAGLRALAAAFAASAVLLVSSSRLVLGAHRFSDVAAGVLLGLLVLAASMLVRTALRR